MNLMRSEHDSEVRCGESETSQKDVSLCLEKDGTQESNEVTALLRKSEECMKPDEGRQPDNDDDDVAVAWISTGHTRNKMRGVQDEYVMVHLDAYANE